MSNNIILNKQKEILDKLSPEEKEQALKILSEYSKTGESKTYQDLLYSDFKEIPVDIETFVDDNRYLGYAWHDNEGNSKLYPYWREQLKKIFPNNIDLNYNNLIFSGSRGRGKQQSIHSHILTENGYVELKDIKVGDKVFGRDGKLHNVTAIFPQGIKPCYDIIFSDGSKTTSGPHHLWNVIDISLKETDFKTVELQDILNKGIYRKDRPNSPIFKIPMCEPIQFEKKDLPIDPYVLGVLLGDGCLCNNSMSFTTADDEIINNVSNYLNEDYKLTITNKLENNKSKIVNIVRKKRKNIPNDYLTILESLKLRGTNSYNKFIPNIYKYASVEDRIKLLQGLLDTDGSAEPNPDGKSYKVCYYTISEQLKNDVVWLVQSLGGTAKWRIKDKSKDSKANHNIFVIHIHLPTNIEPFILSRKLNKYRQTVHRAPSRYIKDIIYRGEEECVCLLVDNFSDKEEHLYITDDFIVTHNSEVSVLVLCYLMYRIMCLKDPLTYYHMKPTEKICFAFMNIKLDLAEDIADNKFQNTVKTSPWFLEHGTLEGKSKKYWVPPDYIEIRIGSQPSDVIGLPIFGCFFDEISFIRNQDIDKQKEKAIDMIDTAIGGMKTRFIYKGKNPTVLILASSKRSEKSFLEEHMKQKLKSEKENVLISDGSVWEVKPKGTYKNDYFYVAIGNKWLNSQVIPEGENIDEWRNKGYKILEVPLDFKPNFIDDIDRALCDYAGISSTELSKYISGRSLEETLNTTRANAFNSDIIEVGNAKEDLNEYKNFFDINKLPKDMMSKPLFIHLDMSLTGDMTGIAGVWIKGKKPTSNGNPSKDLVFQLAFSVSIKAPKGYQISFEKNRNFIRWLKEEGFNIHTITSDTYQAYDLQQQLKAEGYNCEILSVDRVDPSSHICIPYQYFKSTIDEKRIDLYPSKRLIDEIIDLERNLNTGKVDHPPNGHKDVCDAVCGAVFTASKYAEQFAYNYGEELEQMLSLNEESSANEQRQLIIDLENELKNMGPVLKNSSPNPGSSSLNNSPTTEEEFFNPYDDILIF